MENQNRLENNLDESVPAVEETGEGMIVYGKKDKTGVIKGKIYIQGQDPEDGPIGDYSNVPFSQHSD